MVVDEAEKLICVGIVLIGNKPIIQNFPKIVIIPCFENIGVVGWRRWKLEIDEMNNKIYFYELIFNIWQLNRDRLINSFLSF